MGFLQQHRHFCNQIPCTHPDQKCRIIHIQPDSNKVVTTGAQEPTWCPPDSDAAGRGVLLGEQSGIALQFHHDTENCSKCFIPIARQQFFFPFLALASSSPEPHASRSGYMPLPRPCGSLAFQPGERTINQNSTRGRCDGFSSPQMIHRYFQR